MSADCGLRQSQLLRQQIDTHPKFRHISRHLMAEMRFRIFQNLQHFHPAFIRQSLHLIVSI